MSVLDRLSRFADRLEQYVPWFSWNRWGDPVSWIHHTIWSLLIRAPFAFFGHPLVGATIALLYYWHREGWGIVQRRRAVAAGNQQHAWVDRTKYGPTPENGFAPQRGLHVGYMIDAIGDVTGATLIFWFMQ